MSHVVSKQEWAAAAACLSDRIAVGLAALVALGLASGVASAQTVGFATLPPGSLNHTTASAIAKVMKDKANLNVLVQPTAGDNVIIPMVSRGEAQIGIANAPELHNAYEGGGPGSKPTNLRIIAAAHVLRTAFFVRKDAPMKTVADLRGKRVVMGYSAMRVLDKMTRAILATGGLTEKDVAPVLVPNVVRGANDFVSGAADMFWFAFGAPKVREVDATVGGIRVLDIDEKGMPAALKISKWGYLLDVKPGPVFVGVTEPMDVYSFDNLLFTHANAKDELIYKFLETMEKNKSDLVGIQPVLREFSPSLGYAQYDIPYHPGALKFYKERGLKPRSLHQ